MSDVSYKSPLYIQLREVIRNKIEESEYLPGTAIPSENQLMEAYGLNRVSVRSALAALEYEGLLKSVQGKGVFVVGPKAERGLDSIGGFRSTAQEQNSRNHTIRVLAKDLRKAGPFYAHILEISPETNIWFIRRIASVDGRPIALEEIYVPYDVMPAMESMDVQLFSFYDLCRWNGVDMAENEQTLSIAQLPQAIINLLNMEEGRAVMQFTGKSRDKSGKVVEYARCYLRNDVAEFTIHTHHK